MCVVPQTVSFVNASNVSTGFALFKGIRLRPASGAYPAWERSTPTAGNGHSTGSASHRHRCSAETSPDDLTKYVQRLNASDPSSVGLGSGAPSRRRPPKACP